MKFLIDNAVSPEVALGLSLAGHDALHVRDVQMQHAADEAIFDYAATDERVIVSADTDFGTLLATRKTPRPSVILFRRAGQRRPQQQVRLLLANLATISRDLDQGSMVVLEDHRIRVRRLPMDVGNDPLT